MVVYPTPWLLAPVIPNDDTLRWRMTGVLGRAPAGTFTLPVRDMRVL